MSATNSTKTSINKCKPLLSPTLSIYRDLLIKEQSTRRHRMFQMSNVLTDPVLNHCLTEITKILQNADNYQTDINELHRKFTAGTVTEQELQIQSLSLQCKNNIHLPKKQ